MALDPIRPLDGRAGSVETSPNSVEFAGELRESSPFGVGGLDPACQGGSVRQEPRYVVANAIADMLIAVAYLSIPIELMRYLFANPSFPFRNVIYLFSTFIVACGSTHLIATVNLWSRQDLLTCVLKVFTAGISCFTAVILYFIIPPVLQLPEEMKGMKLEIFERAESERLLRDENESMNLFRDITHKIRRTLDRTDILSAVSTEVAQRFDADRCLVFLPSFGATSNGRSTEPTLRCVCEGVNAAPPSSRPTSTSPRAGDDASGPSSPRSEDAENARLLGREEEDDEDHCPPSVPTDVDRRSGVNHLSPPATAETRLQNGHAPHTVSPFLPSSAPLTRYLDVLLPRTHSAVIAARQCLGATVETSLGELFRGREGDPDGRDRTALLASVDLGKLGYGVIVLVLRPASRLTPGRKTLFADIAEQTGIALQQASMMETERVRTEELAERNASLRMVQKEIRVAREQKDFTAVMSHEMRTPLFAISALSSMILELGGFEERAGLEEVEEMMNVIKSSGDMLISIVNNILDFSKYDDEHFRLDLNPFVLRDAVEASAELVAMQDVEGRYPQIVLMVSRDLPIVVVGDITRLRQLIVNLISNACKFTGPEGDVVVTVSRADGGIPDNDDEEAGIVRVKVSVVDSGIGIDKDAAGMLFEKFTQADASIRRKFGGTGLGLAIARQLCKLMKGDITARPNVGEPGTTFEFTACLQAYRPTEWEASGTIGVPCTYTLMNPKYDGFVIGVIEERVKSWNGLKEKLLACGNVRTIHYPDIQAMLQSTEPVNGVIFDYRTVLLLDGADDLRTFCCSPSVGPRIMVLLTARFRRCPKARVRRSEHDLSTHRGRPLKMADLTAWLDSLHELGGAVSVRERLNAEEALARVPPPQQLEKQTESGAPSSPPRAGPVQVLTSAERPLPAALKLSTGLRSASTGSRLPQSPQSFAPPSSVLSAGPGGMASAGSTVVVGGSISGVNVPADAALSLAAVPKLSVLVVEDNKVNQMVIGKILTKLGHAYELANDGQQGVRMVEAKFVAGRLAGDAEQEERGRRREGSGGNGRMPGMYDVILMDIMMPNLDGRAATKEIRGLLGEDTRPWIIGLSANAFWEERMLCFEVGMNDFIG
ncbi:hypothetical protein HK101_009373 [Irineochytrium annulatum]|nr:hypothetical protein HK101_009373 [Irineochytrium annulatum]